MKNIKFILFVSLITNQTFSSTPSSTPIVIAHVDNIPHDPVVSPTIPDNSLEEPHNNNGKITRTVNIPKDPREFLNS